MVQQADYKTGSLPDIRREPPSQLLLAAEAPRLVAEGAALLGLWPLLRRLPKGDGHTVLILPGFGADDMSTAPLRQCLNRFGYEAHGWGLGVNLGGGTVRREAVREVADKLYERSGQPITLIGHSLGGIYARELTRARPFQYRQVITLGSPFSHGGIVANNVTLLMESVMGNAPPEISEGAKHRLASAPPVPTTAIYSKRDGVVPWQSCLQDLKAKGAAGRAENIEVPGSHTGLIVNPAVLYVLADRLRQPHYSWQPFQPRGISGMLYKRLSALVNI